LHRLQPPNQSFVPGRHNSHSVAFIKPVQGSTPSRPQVLPSSPRVNPVIHSQIPEAMFKTVLPVRPHDSQFLNPSGHESHSGSKQPLSQSLGRIHGKNPQLQSTHESPSLAYHGPHGKQSWQPSGNLSSIST
jgi:hypothetical protein